MQLVSLSLAGKNNDVPPSHVEVENFRDSDAHLAATRDDDGNNMSDGYGKNRGLGLRTERLFNMRANMTNRRKKKRRGRSGEDDDEEEGGGGRRRSGSGGRRSSSMAERNPSLTKFPDGGFRSRQRSSSPEVTPRGRRKGRLMVNYDKFASNPFRRNAGGGDVEEMVAATRGGGGGDRYRSDRSRGGSSHGGRSRRSNRSGRSGKSGRSGRSGRSSRSGLSREFKAHPWILPPHMRLAPRLDAWFALAVTSAAAVASVSQIELASKRAGLRFDANDNYALSTCAISLIFSLFVATGTRYAPMRTTLTKNLFPLGPGRLSDVKLTLELVALTILSIMWMAAMPIIVSGNEHYSAMRDVPLAMAGTDIWNANLYYSSWASFLLCAYLWVEVFTLSDRRGTLKVDSSSSIWRVHAGNTFTKRWMLLFLNSVILTSASIGVYRSPSCEGDLLKQTPYCTRALLGVLIGGVLQILTTLGVAALYRLRNMSPNQARRGRGNNYSSPPGSSMLSARGLKSGSGLAALLSLIVQGVNAGLLTSPTGGGPGNVSGTLYFSSWLGLALAFEMCLRYLELCSTSSRSASANSNLARSCGRSVNEETTVFEDDDDDDDDHDASTEESQMMLDMGPVAVEDVTDEDDEDYMDEVQTQESGGEAMDEVQTQQSGGEAMDEVQTQQSGGESLDAKSFVFPFNAEPLKPGQQQQQQRKQVDPEEVLSRSRGSASRSRSRGSKGSKGSRSSRGSGWKRRSDPESGGEEPSAVGSIDVRSSPDEASQSAYGNDPDGAAAIRTSSHYYGEFNGPDGVEDSSKGSRTSRGSSSGPGVEPVQQGNQRRQPRDSLFSVPDPKPGCSSSFSGPGMEPVQQGNAYSGRKSKHRSGNAEPDCPIISHTSYYSDQVEKLDDIPSTTKKTKEGVKSQPERDPMTAQISQLANKLKGQRENENPPVMRHSTATNLSSLEEGSGEEISPNTGTSNTNASNNSGDENDPLTVDGDEPENESPQQQQQREVGANLRTMQAMCGMDAPPPSVQQADRFKKSGSSKMSSASASGKSKSRRTRSKEKKGGMSGLSPAGGMAANNNDRGYGSGNRGAQMSKQSGKSSQSRKTNMSSVASTRSSVILTDHSEQEGNGVSGSSSTRRQQRFNQLGSKKSKSTRSKMSTSTISSRGVSTTSAILTDDEESGSNPPPTISDGMSTKDDLSGFSALSSSKKSGSNSNNNRNNKRAASSGPPPPPFRHSNAQTQSDYGDSASQYSSQAPVRSIHTHKGSNGDDTIVSDPTLDAGLDQSPQGPNPMASRTSPQRATAVMVPPPRRQKKANAAGRGLHDSSSTNSATNSYDKKYSDETEVRNSSSSDGNPLSHEGGGSNKVVDNIVAAALAYAEKTHSESDPIHGGFNSSQQQQAKASKSQNDPHPPPAEKKKQQQPQQQQQHSLRHRASSNTSGSSSFHSFFTESQEDDSAGQGGGDPSLSSAPSSSAPVEDLVAKALSHAQGQLVQDRQGASVPQEIRRSRSEYSSQYWSKGNDSGKSMGSMYSEDDTEYTGAQGVGTHYDC